MDNCKKTLEECGLDDLGFVGDAFTWRNNSHDTSKYVRERLDRAVIRLQRIYNFLCFMLDYISVPYVFISFWHDLWN